MEIINLDMTPSTVTPNAHAGQYDASRTVRFMLKNGGVPFTLAGTETITAEITRSDNTEVTVNVENTSSNYVDVVFDDTVCTVKGLYACELRLKDSDGFDIGSKNFALLVQRDPYDGAGIRVVTVGPADICTFETTLPEPLQSVLVNVLATGGNGTPDNPNPINGYTEANITRCGVNLWDEVTESGRYDTDTGVERPDASWTRSKNFIPVKSESKIYIKSSLSVVIYCYGLDKSYISKTNRQNATFTIPSGVYYLHITWNDNAYNNDISLNYPSTQTSYVAHTDNDTYTIAFGQTVYGGVLDVTRGKLHVTWTIIDLGDDTLNYSYNSTYHRFDCSNDLGAKPAPDNNTPAKALCSCYKNGCVNDVGHVDKFFYIVPASGNGKLRVVDTDYSDVATFKTAVAGQKVAFELATPFDIDLTPEVISAVVGTNNVFGDCGQTTVKYLKAGD